jgi:Na+-transporting NADH:ubiquinone oxidoreductase subunit F
MIPGLSTIATIITSIVVFLLVIMLLVLVLLYARRKLTPQGDVKFVINDKELTVSPGSTILSTLSSNGVFLPSACAGGGTCGMCKCQVLEGGGSILPTETGFFTRKEQQNDWRLGCQVKVREDTTIKVPKSVMGIKKYECEVISNKNVSTFIKEFVVKLPEGESLDFESGGYVQIDVPKYDVSFRDMDIDERFRGDWDRFNMWDIRVKNSEETYRAYSMANHPAEGDIIKLNVRIATPPWDAKNGRFKNVPAGLCSTYIFTRKPGDKVMISGPYGEFHIKETDNEMVYIGGGAGMAPLRSHIMHLFNTEKTDRRVTYWYGARSKREIFYEEDFRKIEKEFPNFTFNIALSEPLPEDNWDGYTGFIHQVAYDEYLAGHDEPESIEYYLCGPPIMNESVKDMLWNLGVPEENIALDDFGI